MFHRRDLLTSTAAALALSGCALPQPPGRPLGLVFFTPEEAAGVDAAADRLIPPDPPGPGGRQAGCVWFIDRQLAGPYGSSEFLYMRPPFLDGIPGQGLQSPITPAARYRVALAALDRVCRAGFAGKGFAALPPDQQDRVLQGLEAGSLRLDGTDGRAFFELLLQNVMEGYFADPVHGGNRNMEAWRMIGFPGARYDYRDWVGRPGEAYPLPPVGIGGRADWR